MAKSKEFKATANKLKYSIQKTTDDPDFFSDLLPDHVDPTITTDGGGELSKSFNFRQKANEHGYKVKATAADSSSSNGIVERPHRTMKERMRCMLYSARLGIDFWADALTHATWLYNRTYHTAVKMTPRVLRPDTSIG